MPDAQRLLQLSPARQRLVRMLQAVNFGELQCVHIREGDPTFDGDSMIVLDVKLDKEELLRHELELADFVLSEEVLRLMSQFDQLRNGTISVLRCGQEFRVGSP